MKMLFSIFVVLLVLSAVSAQPKAEEQSSPEQPTTEMPESLNNELVPRVEIPRRQVSTNNKNEFSVWGGFSSDSTRAFRYGSEDKATQGLVAFRYARRFNNSKYVNLKYTADVMPVVAFNYQTYNDLNERTDSSRTAYAFGVVPIGIQANFRPGKKIQPFLSNSYGLLFLKEKVPNENGAKLNFMTDAGVGVEFILNEERTKALSIGYKIQHISNGSRGVLNPGYETNMIYLGYRFHSN